MVKGSCCWTCSDLAVPGVLTLTAPSTKRSLGSRTVAGLNWRQCEALQRGDQACENQMVQQRIGRQST
jgi:hypothetical protein